MQNLGSKEGLRFEMMLLVMQIMIRMMVMVI